MNDATLSCSNISFAYGKHEKTVLNGISLAFKKGCVTAILGNNGAGKSTLLSILGAYRQPTSGDVLLNDMHISSLSTLERARYIALVTQRQKCTHLSVYDQVFLGRKPYITWGSSENDRAIALSAIKRVKLDRYLHTPCVHLSGGELQKVQIARALTQEASILLLDEPTSALDPKNQVEILELIRSETLTKHLTSVMVIHDINLALRFCDQFLLMHDGHIVDFGDLSIITPAALKETYDINFTLIQHDTLTFCYPLLTGEENA